MAGRERSECDSLEAMIGLLEPRSAARQMLGMFAPSNAPGGVRWR
jgi:hypothetical protein